MYEEKEVKSQIKWASLELIFAIKSRKYLDAFSFNLIVLVQNQCGRRKVWDGDDFKIEVKNIEL